MDDDFWLKIYRDWPTETLENEIGVCHRYQQSLLGRVGEKSLTVEAAIRHMITSQCREYIVRQALTERMIK